MKVLNLYACLGGNRYKWPDYCRVTAVENDPELCRLYKDRFPSDNVIQGDAHEYLLNNFSEYDFIWSSPPCPTHSRARKAAGHLPEFPDMSLYQEIIFLQHYFKGAYCVENVIPYYEPLIPGKKRGRHIYWTNFHLPAVLSQREPPKISGVNEVKLLHRFHEYDFTLYKGAQPTQKIARNLVDYQAGLSIFRAAESWLSGKENIQVGLFA